MIDLMGKRKYFFALSLLLIFIGIVGFFVNGLQLDIQFQGGTIMQIEMNDGNFDTNEVEGIVSSAVNKKVTAQKLQTLNVDNQNDKIDLLMLKVSKENTLTGEELNKVVEVLKEKYNVKEDAQMQVQSVAPFMGKEMLGKGLKAALIASLLIVIYVWWRFSVMSGLPAAIMAIVALLHDALIMLSVYTVFRIPINESFVAAVLTILGYSLNDTIIIYDRIRENSTLLRKVPVDELVNKSVVQTLSRSINTVVTTLVCIISVYIFASINNIQSLKEFSLPLIVGLASGAYSSIFIASPLWMMWKKSNTYKKVASKPSKA